MTAAVGTVHLRAAVGPLRPCPFCGGEAALEPDPWLYESVRVACGNDACRVKPKTEYLLACYAGELRAAWNGRAAPLESAWRPAAAGEEAS